MPLANKFKDINDSVFRVVGEKSDGSLVVLQGPYASRGVARGQATTLRHAQADVWVRHGIEPKYTDIYAQETTPKWFRV